MVTGLRLAHCGPRGYGAAPRSLPQPYNHYIVGRPHSTLDWELGSVVCWGMPRTLSGPTSCLLDTPTRMSVRFAGRFINLSEMSRVGELELSYLSMIFNGKREASMKMSRRIAAVLGMDLVDYLEEMESHRSMLQVMGRKIA